MPKETYCYYAVYYNKDGTITLWKGDSREQCHQRLLSVMRIKKWHDRCDRTTIIKRNAKELPYIFGKPESLNILEEFDKQLKKGKECFNK